MECLRIILIRNSFRIIAGESVIFTVSSNKDFTNLYIFTEMRGSVQSMGCWKFNGKRSHKFGFRLTDDMAPFSRLLVFTINNNQIIMGSLELDFEYFANEVSPFQLELASM